MGKVLLCTGDYAKTPYYFENLGIRVFSAEELCYVLKENAILIDRELIDRKLVKWIEDSLHLKKLAGMLYPMLQKRTSTAAFAGVILQYVQFYDKETIQKTEAVFKTGANLNAYEKLKSRVDYMVENKRYASALTEYDSLLTLLPEGERELTARILHNKGVALCGLFVFEEAARNFKLSFDLLPETETLVEYLAAMRLSMSEEDYVAFAAGFPDYYEETLELESRVEALRAEWETSQEKQYLTDRLSMKEEGGISGYYAETDRKVQELKNKYRTNVS